MLIKDGMNGAGWEEGRGAKDDNWGEGWGGMEEREWPEEYIRAVQSHGYGLCVDVKPVTLLEKTLYAIDELTGLITATALVRPSKSVMDMKAKSVKKKWKAKQFASGVDRSIIEKGAEDLGVELTDLITDTIMGMREVSESIGLLGNVEGA